MIDRKPYLVRAIYEWIVDNGWTPHIVVDTTTNEVSIPDGYDQDGYIILNIAPTAVQGLHIENDNVSFSARFGGKACSIWFPIASVAGIYARENNEGLQLSVTPVEEEQEVVESKPGLVASEDTVE
jgi:stringent starvation protein B